MKDIEFMCLCFKFWQIFLGFCVWVGACELSEDNNRETNLNLGSLVLKGVAEEEEPVVNSVY